MFYAYKNGNYNVVIDSKTGTKIRTSNEKQFIPAFAENCDITITTKCDNGCEFCYLGCSNNGIHADLSKYDKLIDSLHPYTELAMNGNDMTHPGLVPFLDKLKRKHVFANLTVNQNHFIKHQRYIKRLYEAGLLHGIGISLNEVTDELLQAASSFPTVVIHTINGITKPEDYEKLASQGGNIKILVLGLQVTGKRDKF